MGDARGLDHPHAVQFDELRTHPVKQADAAAEQHGNQVKLRFVRQSSADELPHDIRTAPKQDILCTCGCLRLGEGAGNAISDEGVGGASLPGQELSGAAASRPVECPVLPGCS